MQKSVRVMSWKLNNKSMILGFSTGCLYKTHERVSKETFDVFRKIGCNAIEVTCKDKEAIKKLIKEISPSDLLGFSYVSLHAPNVCDIETLNLLQEAQKIFNFETIVLHPEEVENWDIFRKFNLPFTIENMDWRKEIGKSVESMEDIFSKLDVHMVLDINHCFTVDRSMQLAQNMFEKFHARISELHLSGFENFHEPLFRTKQMEIINAIPGKNIPIIIESGCETVEDVKAEFAFIKSFLEKKK